MKDKHIFLALGAAVILVAIIATFVTSPGGLTGFSIFGSSSSVDAGDTVSVLYIGTLQNGSVFDTNREDVAMQSGIYNPAHPYEPLTFVVGVQQMIQGFDESVQEMRVGDRKEVTIAPEKAYGQYDPSRMIVAPRVEVVNRTVEINRTLTITTAQFANVFGTAPIEGETFTTTQAPWEFNVTRADLEKVTIQALVSVGDKISLPSTSWNSTITAVSDKIKLRHDPKAGQMIETPFGNATLEVTSKEIKIITNPKKGTVISTMFGQSVVKDVNATSVILDVNHPLAGKTLVFDIEVVAVNKTTA